MSTQLQLFIYDCPPDQAWAAWQVIDRYELDEDWDGPAPKDGQLIVGGAPYTHRAAASGETSNELADELVEAAPGISFLVWTDATVDWLGALVRYTPGLGMFKADCTTEGDVRFGASEVVRMAKLDIGRVERYVGLPWEEAQNHSAEERVIRFEVPAA